MFWRISTLFKGKKGFEKVLKGNLNTEKELQKFCKAYLKRSFDNSLEEPFKIFEFLDNNLFRNSDFKYFEDLIINSKYMDTMPEEYVIEAILAFDSLELSTEMKRVIRTLFYKIKNPKLLLENSMSEICHLISTYFPWIIDKLLELDDMEYIKKISFELDISDNFRIMQELVRIKTIVEICNLCIEGNFAANAIFSSLLYCYKNDKIKCLDSLWKIMISKDRTFFKQCLTELKNRQEFTEEDKNYLALKLVETKEYSKMLDWVSCVDCDTNKKMIDELVGRVADFVLVYSTTEKYVSYALENILKHSEINEDGFKVGDEIFYGEYDEEKLNFVLNCLFDIEPNIKFSKRIVIKLLKLEVNKFPVLINDYQFTPEEKLEIFEALRAINSDWLIVYGVYLLGGDRPFEATRGETIMNNIRTRRKKEEM